MADHLEIAAKNHVLVFFLSFLCDFATQFKPTISFGRIKKGIEFSILELSMKLGQGVASKKSQIDSSFGLWSAVQA